MKDFSMPNTIINVTLTRRVPNASNFCAVTLILSPYGIIAILIKHITWHFLFLNLKIIKHFIMVNELSTLGAFIDIIRKGNYSIFLDVKLKNPQLPAKKLGHGKAFSGNECLESC